MRRHGNDALIKRREGSVLCGFQQFDNYIKITSTMNVLFSHENVDTTTGATPEKKMRVPRPDLAWG